jgi:hypothetical protein
VKIAPRLLIQVFAFLFEPAPFRADFTESLPSVWQIVSKAAGGVVVETPPGKALRTGGDGAPDSHRFRNVEERGGKLPDGSQDKRTVLFPIIRQAIHLQEEGIAVPSRLEMPLIDQLKPGVTDLLQPLEQLDAGHFDRDMVGPRLDGKLVAANEVVALDVDLDEMGDAVLGNQRIEPGAADLDRMDA